MNNRRVYLEVDPRHPLLIQQWLKANVEEMHYVETRQDISSRSVKRASLPALLLFNWL